jgi:MFS family permease
MEDACSHHSSVKLFQHDPPNPVYNVDNIQEIYEAYGYGKETFKYVTVSFLVIMCYGLYLSIFGVMIHAYREVYKFTQLEEKIASSCIFIGLACGSLTLSLVSKAKQHRRAVLLIFILFLTVLHFTMVFVYSTVVFIIVRFFIGAAIGIILPNSYTLLIEYLPMKFRSFVLMFVWVGYPVARVILLGIMLIYMPNLESEYTEIVLLWNSALPLLTFVICLFFVRDSPRNLIMVGDNKTAFEILEIMLKRQLNEKEKQNILESINDGYNKELKGNLCDMFSVKLLRSSICLICMWCIHGFVYYGTFVTSSLTLEKIDPDAKTTYKEIIVGQMIVAVLITPPIFIIGYLTETPFFGRRKSSMLTFSIGLLGMILAPLIPSQFAVIYGIGTAFMSAGSNLNSSYSSEVYPTKVRESALSFFYFISRIMTALAQVVYLYVFELGIYVPYYFSIGFLVILIAAIFLLPYETHNKQLDEDLSVYDEESFVKFT